MKYVDDLNDFLYIVKDDPCAEIGVHKKHPTKAPFHAGHIHCIKEMLKLKCKYKVVLMWDSEKGMKYVYNRTVQNRPLNLNYMKSVLEKTGIDIFYYLKHEDFINKWLPKIDLHEYHKFIDEVITKENYPRTLDIANYFPAYIFDQFFNRKYWVGSSKDNYRVCMKDFCKKYTNTEVYIIKRITNQTGKIYTSSEGIV